MTRNEGRLWREHGRISSTKAPSNVVELTSEEMARQDAEAEALRGIESPVYDVFESPWTADEDDRRRLLAKAGIDAPRPKSRTESWEAVEPERATTRRTIRHARRLTPDYGQEGP